MSAALSKEVAETKPLFAALADDEKAAYYRSIFEGEGVFQREFGVDDLTIDGAGYPEQMRKLVYDHIKQEVGLTEDIDFESIHTVLSDELRAYDFDYGVNKVSTYCYEISEEFSTLYQTFLEDIFYNKIFKRPFLFQATPTIRIHCPDGENSHHYPRYHTDIAYGHPSEEINIWFPLTNPKPPQQHGFRLTSLDATRRTLDSFDYHLPKFIDKAIEDKGFNKELNADSPEMDTELGQCLLFDSRRVHTGEPLEQHTRVSMDIRILLLDDYHNMPYMFQGSGRRKIKYVPGEGYDQRIIGA